MEERTVRNRLLHQFTALGQVGFLREPASGRGGNVIAAPPSCRLTHVAPHTLLPLFCFDLFLLNVIQFILFPQSSGTIVLLCRDFSESFVAGLR